MHQGFILINMLIKKNKMYQPSVLKALGNIPIITKKMWQTLKEEVMQYGLFHSYRLAIAPTGSYQLYP